MVEFATVEDLFDFPQHPYTEGLFRSVPRLGAHATRLETIPGMVPNPMRFPGGCKFHPRCARTQACAAAVGASKAVFPAGTNIAPAVAMAIDSEGKQFPVLKKCATEEPTLREVKPSHWSACHVTENYEKSPTSVPKLEHKREVVPVVVDGDAIVS